VLETALELIHLALELLLRLLQLLELGMQR
jgi:hypothetical protein